MKQEEETKLDLKLKIARDDKHLFCDVCGREVWHSNLWPIAITDDFMIDNVIHRIRKITFVCVLCLQAAQKKGFSLALHPEELGRVLQFRSKQDQTQISRGFNI